KFCQNWDISKSRDMERLAASAGPEAIARAARDAGAASVAFTYNDPTIFAEYAMDAADACHALGLHTVSVTAGYIHAAPREELYRKIDAANVDLKAFTDAFYRDLAAARLEPVKETLKYLVHETKVWTEITTLLIPGHNDSEREVGELSAWVARELGPDVPLHFSAFHPDYKMMDVPPTPVATLRRARRRALAEGLRFVYTGNVHDREGDATLCPGCGAAVIERDWYEILATRLRGNACAACGAVIPGRFGAEVGRFGRRRMRVVVGG
ncbi:MAG TPA: AmmeMemoRadiSam system radical SAM enzyme, partial [Anaeromyxobacteraceae bacterium]|nr:AmmeMemoRadiSam system radical SAM enzyme [Anaeromyxobacteraceae bacterium]